MCSKNLGIFVRLFSSLYADNTIILSETEAEMQYALSIFEKYCHHWKLKVNLQKTKVIIFCKRKSKSQPIFKLCGENLQIEDSYSYLGVIFNYSGSFVKPRAKLMNQARKALYCLHRKLRNISIPIDLQLKLHDTHILPILTYGCEVWDYENTDLLEKLHLQFCRKNLGIRTTNPNFMTYGELGRIPIDIYVKLRVVYFWNKLISNQNKLSFILYKIMFNLSIIDNV
jgi:hypothetical protein